MSASPRGSRAMTHALAVATAVLALAGVVVGALAVADGRASITAMGVALLVSAAVFGTMSALFAVALRRTR
ncbi:hypothetical protein [Clavibacter zhangzhiyongii]|uniref:hypothetical protein n=1 Tax=Clavibacter zhangzhiyongii TaxID=2768071 RepID=UPI0039DFE74B